MHLASQLSHHQLLCSFVFVVRDHILKSGDESCHPGLHVIPFCPLPKFMQLVAQGPAWSSHTCLNCNCLLQTDGWLSDKSASVYETSTETLFIGRQDAMQRTAMVPLADFMKARLPEGQDTKVLEVACGTGRFGTFLKVWHDPVSGCASC